jgi:hypothetical protein
MQLYARILLCIILPILFVIAVIGSIRFAGPPGTKLRNPWKRKK